MRQGAGPVGAEGLKRCPSSAILHGFHRMGIHPVVLLPLGVTGNTPDSGSGESRFDPWRGNEKARRHFGDVGPFFVALVRFGACARRLASDARWCREGNSSRPNTVVNRCRHAHACE